MAGVEQLKQRLIENLPHACRAKLVDWCLQLSTREACKILAARDGINVLIDNSTLRFGRTHETIGLAQKTNWPPGEEPGEIPILYRAPIVFDEQHKRVNENTPYLPGIAYLARVGRLTLKTSRELLSEQNHHPVGAAQGKTGWFDYWIFDEIEIDSIDGHDAPSFDLDNFRDNPTINRTISSKEADPFNMYPDNMENLDRRISRSTDPLYTKLAKILKGKKKNFDAWHIRTAETHRLFCFLTMDFNLREAIMKNSHTEPIASLRTKVMTPEEFGTHFGLSPIDPYICELAESDAMKSSARLRKALRRRGSSASSM